MSDLSRNDEQLRSSYIHVDDCPGLELAAFEELEPRVSTRDEAEVTGSDDLDVSGLNQWNLVA